MNRVTVYNRIIYLICLLCTATLFSGCRKIYHDVPYINAYYHVESFELQCVGTCKVDGIDYIQIKLGINDISNSIWFKDKEFDAVSKRHNDNIRRDYSPWLPKIISYPENDLVSVYIDGQEALTSHSFFTAISISTYVRTEEEYDYNVQGLSPFSKIEYNFDGKRIWHPVENYLDQLSKEDLLLLDFSFMDDFPYAAIYIPKEEIPDNNLTLVLVDVHGQEFKLNIPNLATY